MHVKNIMHNNEKRSKVLSNLATIMFLISTLSAFFIAFIPITSTNSLIDVTATPSDTTAGVTTMYTINFTTIATLTVNPTPSDRIVITFQEGFDASGATVNDTTATYSTSDPTLASATATIVTLDVTAREYPAKQSIVLNGIINTQTPGTKNVNVVTQNGKSAYSTLDGPTDSTPFTINAPSATKLVFSSGTAQTLTAGVCSSVIVIQRQDASSNPVSTDTPPITVALSTGSAGGTFYSDSGCTAVIASIDIAAGASDTASFYYKDSVVGTPALTGPTC